MDCPMILSIGLRLNRNSIRRFFRLLFPGTKARESFVAHHLHHGNVPLRMRPRDLFVDEGIAETDFPGIGSPIPKKDSIQMSPVDGAKTHRARLAGCVELAALQI